MVGGNFEDLARGFWKKHVFLLTVGGHVEGGCYRNDGSRMDAPLPTTAGAGSTTCGDDDWGVKMDPRLRTSGMTRVGEKMDPPLPTTAGADSTTVGDDGGGVACRCVGVGWAQILRSSQDDNGGIRMTNWEGGRGGR